MRYRWVLTGIVWTAACGWAQTSHSSFEVASVKVNTHCNPNGPSGGRSTPGQISQECGDLRDLILTAYGIYGNGANPVPGSFRMQVAGGPAWMDSTFYDILAKAPGNPPRSEVFGPMLRALLEERFKLQVHREVREGPVYFLALGKNGPKLRAAPADSCVIADIDHPAPGGTTSVPLCGKTKTTRSAALVTLDIPGATIADLCTQLNLVMDREVIDRTSLTGRFDIHLEVAPADLQLHFVAGRAVDQPGDSGAGDQDGPSISTALQQQLGLRLEKGRGPVPVLVVDHIERLKEN